MRGCVFVHVWRMITTHCIRLTGVTRQRLGEEFWHGIREFRHICTSKQWGISTEPCKKTWQEKCCEAVCFCWLFETIKLCCKYFSSWMGISLLAGRSLDFSIIVKVSNMISTTKSPISDGCDMNHLVKKSFWSFVDGPILRSRKL